MECPRCGAEARWEVVEVVEGSGNGQAGEGEEWIDKS